MSVLNNDAQVIFNNADVGVPSTTGRDAGGQTNGTLSLDDLFHQYASRIDLGFQPDTFLLHPAAWQILGSEGIARHLGILHNVNNLPWKTPRGWSGNPWKGSGGLAANNPDSPTAVATTYTELPGIFPTRMRVVVSPFVNSNATTRLTDIFAIQAVVPAMAGKKRPAVSSLLLADCRGY